MTARIGDTWYRYNRPYIPNDLNGKEPVASLEYFTVAELTPAGVWLMPGKYTYSPTAPKDDSCYRLTRRWVSISARKRYAYPTKELARNSYTIRQKWALSYASRAYDIAAWCNQPTLFEGLDEIPTRGFTF